MLSRTTVTRLALRLRDFLNTNTDDREVLRAGWGKAVPDLWDPAQLQNTARKFLTDFPTLPPRDKEQRSPNKEQRWRVIEAIMRHRKVGGPLQKYGNRLAGEAKFVDGRMELEDAEFGSINDAVAIILVELSTNDPPAAVYRCEASGCNQFIFCDLHRRGKRQRFCSERCKRARRVRRKSK